MHRAFDRVTMETTVHLLVAGFALIAAGLSGLRGTAVLVGILLAITVVLFTVRSLVPPLGTIFGYDLQGLLENSWGGPAVAAITAAITLGATPGELQSLGGLLGLAAMANYFLRPAYFIGYSLVASALNDARPIEQLED